LEGFIVWDYKNRFELAIKELSKWVQEGRIKYKEHIIEGIENAPRALAMLFSGENEGKMIVRLTPQNPTL